jgi:L-iditol 2-dehydrogenase
MLRAVLEKPGQIKYQEVEKPKPQAEEVVIKIEKIAVCTADISVFNGLYPSQKYPVVQGHEISGTVVELGEKASGVPIGAKVTIMPQITCGKCFACTHQNHALCSDLKVIGFELPGAAQEYFAIHQDQVLELAPGMSFDQGCFIEPASIAIHALHKFGEIKNKNFLIVGSGMVETLVAQIAVAMGAGQSMIIDSNPIRLEKARACGVKLVQEYSADMPEQQLRSMIWEKFENGGPDKIMIFGGRKEVMEQKLNKIIHISDKCTHIVVDGVRGDATLDLFSFGKKELVLTGLIGTMVSREAYLEGMALFRDGKIVIDPLIDRYFEFKEYDQAYQYINNNIGGFMRSIINMNE